MMIVIFAMLTGAAIAEDKKKTYSQEELDQMMAPIALYPDSLLSQILMAATYPDQVAEAVKWSKDNPGQKGDDAVKAVQNKAWDPSVMSLVAFPQVLEMMGQKSDWVDDLGNAFLADSDAVMDTAQSLRKKAQDAGNLKTTEEQTVSTTTDAGTQTIVIQPANPSVVYVPVYNPTVVYGVWWYPAYPPYYYHPVGYSFSAGLASGIGFGIGIGITNALWGGFNWGHHDIDINVNRHNNINVNRNKLDVNSNSTTWNRNSSTRNNVNVGGATQRENFRGRDVEREQARAKMEKRGIDPSDARKNLQGSGGDKAREAVNNNRGNYNSSKLKGKAGGDHDFSRSRPASADHALNNVSNSNRSFSNIDRGMSSSRSTHGFSGGSRGGGHRGGGRRR